MGVSARFRVADATRIQRGGCVIGRLLLGVRRRHTESVLRALFWSDPYSVRYVLFGPSRQDRAERFKSLLEVSFAEEGRDAL